MLAGVLLFGATETIVGSEYVVDVPEGETYTGTSDINASAGVTVLVKTGAGRWNTGSYRIGPTTNFEKMEVREGTLGVMCHPNSENGGFHPPLMVIKSGATVFQMRSDCYQNNGVTIQIDKGGTFDENCAKSFESLKAITGAGTLKNTAGNHLGPQFTAFTGSLVNDYGPGRADSTFGDGATTANDFDWSKVEGYFVFNDYVRDAAINAYFKNVAPTHFATFPMQTSFAVTTNKNGYATYASTYFYNDVAIDDLATSRLRPVLNQAGTTLTINGGRADFTAPQNSTAFSLVDGSAVTINGGRFTGTGYISEYSRNRYNTVDVKDGSTTVGKFIVSHVNFRYNNFGSNAAAADFVVNGGYQYGCSFTKRTYLRGGKINWSAPYNKGATAHSNVWDGAKCYAPTSGDGAFTIGIDRADTPIVPCVGKKGGWFETYGCNSPNVELNNVWKSACPPGETDGGMKFFGRSYVGYKAMPEFRGPLEVNASYLRVRSEISNCDSDHLFGYGDLRLGNTFLQTMKTGAPIRLAGGPGAKLVVKGAAQVIYPNATTAAGAANYVVGPSGATTSSITREKGGVLFLYNSGVSGFRIGTYSSMKVEGGVEKNAAGLPKVVALQAEKEPFGSTAMGASFVGYDNATGYVPYDNALSAFGGRSTDVVVLHNVQTNLTADTAVGALKLNNNNAFVSSDPTDTKANVYLSGGVTLKVGDGTNPALVVMNSSIKCQSAIKGPGAVAFGGSEAVFVVNGYGALLNSTVTGNGDFTFAGVGQYPSMRLCKDQNWAGTVRANNCALRPETDLALGTAKVVIGSGWSSGGTLDLGVDGLTIANDLTLGGEGVQNNVTDGNVRGAIHVRAPATLTGKIDFYGAARIGVADGGQLTIKGELTGDDNLDIVNGKNNSFTVEKTGDTSYEVTETALARDTNGRVIIESTNNGYTGDVSVVRSTLVLKGANPGLGWGDVELDAATLRFENTKPVRIRGRIAGSGVIEIATKQLVTFDDLFGQMPTPVPTVQSNSGYTVTVTNAKDESKFTLDLEASTVAVNSLKGVGAITTSRTKTTHLSVLDDAKGSFTGSVPANVVIHYGKIFRHGLIVYVR